MKKIFALVCSLIFFSAAKANAANFNLTATLANTDSNVFDWYDINKNDWKDKYKTTAGVGFGVELNDFVEIGAEYLKYGEIKLEDKYGYGYGQKINSMFGGGFAKLNLNTEMSPTSVLQLFIKTSLGSYSIKRETLNASDSKTDSAAGGAISAGANMIFGNFIIGAQYRWNFTDVYIEGNTKKTTLELSNIGVNVGFRFGGSKSSGDSNWDSTASQNSFENPTINNNVQQVNNSGWGALGDNSNVAADAPTESVQPAETGVAAVKERADEAMKELEQMSAKNAGTDPVLDKDKFLKKMDKIWNDLDSGAIKEEIAIPSFGILFKIGKSDILPYYNEMLNDFVDLYKKTDGNAKILIEGYSSNNSNKSTGRKSETLFNPSLSQQRVKAVAKYLVKEGIPASNLELKAYRNTKVSSGMFDNDPDCDTNCYRRVNISIK